MKIIKEGKKDIVKFKCQECGCEFELDFLNEEDMKKYSKFDVRTMSRTFYHCPKCDNEDTYEIEETEEKREPTFLPYDKPDIEWIGKKVFNIPTKNILTIESISKDSYWFLTLSCGLSYSLKVMFNSFTWTNGDIFGQEYKLIDKK